MAQVDPFVHPIPSKLRNDPELRPFFDYLNRFLHDLWQRSGGSEDKIENIEVTQVTEDGGNRSSRYLQDEVQDLRDSISDLKRKFNGLRDELDEALEMPPIKNKTINHFEEHHHKRITHLSDVQRFKNTTRLLEQKVNELEERIDSGT